jgi:protein gp37
MATKIEWCDETWNPITGCSPISAGCANCYARRMANRLRGRFGYPADDPFRVTFHPDRLGKPAEWKKPKRIFVCSMGDLFHDENLKVIYTTGDSAAETVIRQIAFYRDLNHCWLLLTKRPENMFKVFNNYGATEIKRTIPNLYLGVTVENQAAAEKRIPELLKLRPYASKLIVSVEPMLERIDFAPIINCAEYHSRKCHFLTGLDWVICGPETGPGKREFKEQWAIDLQRQCERAGVPFFFKGDKLGGQTFNEFPEV